MSPRMRSPTTQLTLLSRTVMVSASANAKFPDTPASKALPIMRESPIIQSVTVELIMVISSCAPVGLISFIKSPITTPFTVVVAPVPPISIISIPPTEFCPMRTSPSTPPTVAPACIMIVSSPPRPLVSSIQSPCTRPPTVAPPSITMVSSPPVSTGADKFPR